MPSEPFSISRSLRRLTRELADSFPLLRFTVREHSMQPGLNPGDQVLALRWLPRRRGSIVIARRNGSYLVKRIERIEDGDYYLLGDNPRQSIDSRHFGPVGRDSIVGVVVHKRGR